VDNLSDLSDDELLAATAEQPEAFGVFYERHARGILGYLARATGDRDVALDLTAEVFAAALTASTRYVPGQTPAAAWLVGIARNKLADSRRRYARAQKARRKLGIPPLSFTDAALERVEQIIDAERTNYIEALAFLDAGEPRQSLPA
jgi:DNA-directed RNA polymerase specialized sigma24 family protein